MLFQILGFTFAHQSTFETMLEQIFVFHFYLFLNLGEECEFSSVSGTLRMLYHDQVYQYVINEHEYFSHVFQGKWLKVA